MRSLFILFILLVTISACKKDNLDREVRNPVIDSISPGTGGKYTTVTVYGSGFGNVNSDVIVLLNGKIMPVSLVTDSKIRFQVLPKSTSGLVAVVVVGNNASGPVFTYIPTYTVSTFAGQAGVAGFADGNSNVALFNDPRGLTIDANENLYIADALNHRIRRISNNGDVVTFTGNGIPGHQDGMSGIAKFNAPYDIQFDAINNFFYVADKLNHCVRRISLAGDVTTAAGIPGVAGYVDAPGLSARLNNPTGLTLEGELANIYICDSQNHCIRKLDQFNVVSTFAGSTTSGNIDGYGNSAGFNSPYDIDFDSSGYLFVSDLVNQNIRRIRIDDSFVSTHAGNGSAGWLDGPGASAWFNNPSGVAAYKNQVAVSDKLNNRIRFISGSKIVSTLAGDGTASYLDGISTNAKFNKPHGIVRTKNGDYFVTDGANHCIRKITVD